MKIIRHFLLALSALLMLWTPVGHADDIDIYTGSTNTGVPNILFVIDTGANFEASAGSVPCTAYGVAAGGGAPSLGNSAGGIEQCALVDAITALTDGAVNIGLLVNNNNNFATDTRVATDAAFHETCMGTYGGCVIRKLALMDATGKASLVNFIKSWKTSGSNSATEFNVKSGGDRTGNTMQEAWAYYNGKLGMSGKNYATSILSSGCQKNFIIFIGNSFNNSGGPADGGAESPDNSTNGLRSAQVGATADQLVKITGVNEGDTAVTFSPSTCGVSSIAASTVASNWSENWADEWARLMKQQDGAGDLEDSQNITTYTIGVVNDSACKADYPALLTTMAKHGGGKYFKTSNASEVKTALDTILNEIQAVNSVFASASLPVSVNAEGTFLNQIFLGMFRPDASANPRWLGNLKQFQLVFSGSNLILGDATGAPALSSAGTGFIASTSTSFWTKKTTASEPDASGGFYQNDPRGIPPSGYDLPDGHLVEKGGAAQQLRIESMFADYTAAAGSSTNPRRLYTYCPSGAACETALAHSSNAFSTDNVGISASAFGDSTTVAISSITRTGTTAEVVTTGNHGFTTGTTQVTISNVTNPTAYNGTYTAQACATPVGNCFKITGLGDYPNPASVNAYTFATIGAGTINVTSLSRTTNGTNTSGSGLNKETVTVTTGGHVFLAGSTVTITGATPSEYNGNHVIAVPGTGACPTLTCFTYEVTVTPTSPAVNTYSAVVSPTGASRSISSITDTGTAGTATVTTTSAHGFHVGQIIKITGTGNGRYDYTAAPSGSNTGTDFTVASITGAAATSTVFTFTGYQGNPSNVGTVGSVLPSTTGITVTPSRTAGTDAITITATAATAGAFGNAIGATKVVDITKATGTSTNESAYVASGVTITCTNANCTTFTYGPKSTSPSTSITGTVTATPFTGGSTTIAAGGITRSGATATVTGATANQFGSPVAPSLTDRTGSTDVVTVAVASGSDANESAYLGNGSWTITCTNASCTTFTFGPVTLTPTTPAVGVNMQAYAAGTAPDKTTLVNWVRGEDNFKDELGPCVLSGGVCTVTVRPSVHGDVLHSRPLVVNYGDSRGLVAFYGSNDGVFRAVNGSQTAAIGTVPAGGELWGLILPEHFGQLNRQRVNSPELKLPTTTLASAQPKDYFVDGATGALQQIKADGTIDKAYLYLTMRRGGRFIYAIDVSEPTAPTVLWKKSYDDATDSKMATLGQTWSRPRVTVVNGYTNPVLIFGGGYDTAEDSEPPTANTQGNSIFVLDAITGARVWSATYGASAGCSTGSTTQGDCTVPEMIYSIPSEVAFRDRDSDGKVDRMYVGDVGGNVWRVDFVTKDPVTAVTENTPDKWRVTRLAAIGCATGACAAGTTPRKIFFPPTVISVGATAATGSYEAVLFGSGDREHPLTSTAAQSSHLVKNRFYMVKDTVTSATPTRSETNLAAIDGITLRTEATLYQAFLTSTITQMVRASNVMTVTTAAAHGFVNGQTVVIDGSAQSTLDGQYTIIDAGVAGSTTFTFASTGSNTSVGAGGNATVTREYATSNTEPGFYAYLAKGEKVVNAPVTVSGTAFFGTNRPFTPAVNTCASNLGEARGYAFDPFSGSATSVVYDGGGLPPSPVAGVVTVNKDGVDTLVRFCIGCGGGENSGSGVDSALENTDPFKPVPKKPTRTYWYRK